MRIMTMYEALLAYGRNYLFCCEKKPFWGCSMLTKQIYHREIGIFCLILPHDPHVIRIVTVVITQNMRFMRMYEGWIFNGIYMPCISIRVRSRPKYEADMREYEGHPHVFGLQARRIG